MGAFINKKVSTGQIMLDYWDKASLPANGELPENPDGRTMIEEFAVLAEWTDKHVVRIRGHVLPPATGSYVFTSTAPVNLYVGMDSDATTARKVLKASSSGSYTVMLEGGTRYFIEAVCTEGAMRVGWLMPDSTKADVIPGEYLSPYNRFEGIPEAHQVLRGLSRQHPRLLATAYDFAVLRDQLTSCGETAAQYAVIKKQAQEYLKQPLADYPITDPYGYNIAGRGNNLIQEMETLGMVYNVEIEGGDQDLAQACVAYAWRELEAISRFLNWDTEHYASTPRMAHAFAMGYDWLYNAFTPEQRAVIRKAVVELAIKAYDKELNNGPFGWHQWTIMKGNWNCVINGETGIAILAVAGEDDYYNAEVLHKLLVNTMNYAMLTWYPDGGTKESPSYWWFKEVFFLPFLPALKTALGADFGLESVTGFAESGEFPLYSMGPSGAFFNYSDGNPRWQPTPGLMYLSKTFNKPLYAWMFRDRFGDTVTPRSILWYDSRGSKDDMLDLPLDAYYSDAEVVYMRGDWEDPNTSWCGFAAIDNYDFIHGQLDQGTFVFDALGERWAEDLGADNYGLPGYWDKDTGGVRWKVYRIRAEGHNTLVINPGSTHEDQHPMAKGKMIEFCGECDSPFAIADMTDAYKQNGARKVRRGVKLVDRTSLLVCDEVKLASPGEVWWFMHTQAEIEVATDGQSAILHKGDKHVTVSILAGPEGVKLIAMAAERLPTSPGPTAGERDAKGYRKLAIMLEDVTDTRLAVILVPDGGTEIASSEVTRLNTWAT